MNIIKYHKDYVFCFFSRNGGVSKGGFTSLNCAFKKGDLDENVKKNRIIASNQLNRKKIIIPNQVHSNIVIRIDKNIHNLKTADAIISNRKDILLGILTADCAPVIVLGNSYYGIIHAGWKGLINGIIENTLNEILSLGEKAENLKVCVGPHLKRDSFEIKKDFIKLLKSKIKNYKNFIVKKKELLFFDFSRLIESKLIELNVKNYSISNQNTYTDPDNFFSHRYCLNNKIKNCGRQISLVGIKNK